MLVHVPLLAGLALSFGPFNSLPDYIILRLAPQCGLFCNAHCVLLYVLQLASRQCILRRATHTTEWNVYHVCVYVC